MDVVRPPRWGRRSTNVTLRPASASVRAALIPARPPPTTTTRDVLTIVPPTDSVRRRRLFRRWAATPGRGSPRWGCSQCAGADDGRYLRAHPRTPDRDRAAGAEAVGLRRTIDRLGRTRRRPGGQWRGQGPGGRG